jgi:hypothetical protein
MTTNRIPNSTQSEIQGLCMTCNHAGFCMYLASASSPIWSCEEFDDRAPVNAPQEIHRTESPTSSQETEHTVEIRAKRQIRRVS